MLRRWVLISILAAASLGLGACSGVSSSSLPSVTLPTSIPSLPAGGSPLTACVDASTFAILDQLKAPGADVQTILTTNKDALVTGLQSFQPADAATTTWRDALVAALQANDTATATTLVGQLASGTVTVTSC
jgi:hypothetical protein